MPDLSFMEKKFSMRTLCHQYLIDIKRLSEGAQSPMEQQKLNYYIRAMTVIHDAKVKDLALFALSFGRHTKGESYRIRKALPTLLGNNIVNPRPIDIEYLKLLISYACAFKNKKHLLKEYILRWIIQSKLSPVKPYVDREIDRVIKNSKYKISHFESSFDE